MGVELESKTTDSCLSPTRPVTDNNLLPWTSTQAEADSNVETREALRGRSDCQPGRVENLSRIQTIVDSNPLMIHSSRH